ncbi:MAG: NUDIX hydrolase [Christensenellales bacterium]|jgi:8-oxo-dGTP pyrophosphatase MutT (NUDIX family)
MSNYIMDLRKIVGHRPLMLVGASVIVVDSDNRILLQQRRDNRCWGYAGGSVELYERVEDAARRELKEETGLIAHSLTLYGVFSGPESRYVYPNGDEVSTIDIVYVCREYSGTLMEQEEEVLALQFFAPDQLPENLSPPVARVIRQFANERLQQAQEDL